MKATKANCDKRSHENLTQTCVASQLELARRFFQRGLYVAVYAHIHMKPHRKNVQCLQLMRISTYAEKNVYSIYAVYVVDRMADSNLKILQSSCFLPLLVSCTTIINTSQHWTWMWAMVVWMGGLGRWDYLSCETFDRKMSHFQNSDKIL